MAKARYAICGNRGPRDHLAHPCSRVWAFTQCSSLYTMIYHLLVDNRLCEWPRSLLLVYGPTHNPDLLIMSARAYGNYSLTTKLDTLLHLF